MFGRISAAQWNSYVRHLATRYPIRVLAGDDGSSPMHTWQVTPRYDGTARQWQVRLRAGAVNGRIATIATTFGRASSAYQTYYRQRHPNNPPSETTRVDVPLDYGPELGLAWREIGGDAPPVSTGTSGGEIRQRFETVPPFFRRQGVPEGGAGRPPAEGQRRLFATEIVLRQQRTFLTNETEILPGGVLGGSIVSVNATSDTLGDSSQPPSLVNLPSYQPAAIQNTFADVFFQRFLDEPTDELHLSTVYALSAPLPPGTSFPEGVDQTFQILTRYYCHYNLAHATRTLPRPRTPPLTLVTGLGVGLGDAIFNLILSTQNDFAQATLDLFAQRSLRGTFWVV